jgi:formylglycine-generating enzyme required for sulfatase activity
MRNVLQICFVICIVTGLTGNSACWAEPKTGDIIENSLKMKLSYIPAGEFEMGVSEWAKKNYKAERVHHVRLTKGFYMGIHEVTVGQFQQFVRESGYKTDAEVSKKGGRGFNSGTKSFERKPEYTWRNPGFEQSDEHPVVIVSWKDATEFCKWLSIKEGKQYRLPTEAEWEYACRARTKTEFYFGDDAEDLATAGNVPDGSAKERFAMWANTIAARDGYVFTAPVGKFKPNPFGLYDMYGNVWEWCADLYGEYSGDAVDPTGSTSGPGHLLRGGSWYGSAFMCRSAVRAAGLSEDYSSQFGFRVVSPR